MAKKKFELSNERKEWVGSRTVNLKGLPLHVSASIPEKYQKGIDKLLEAVAKETARELKVLFKGDAAKTIIAQDASITSQTRIIMNRLSRKFDRVFSESARVLANNHAKRVDNSSKTTLKMSLKQLSGGLTIPTDIYTQQLNEEISASIEENVSLIVSVGEDYLTNVREDVFRMIQNPDSGGLKGLIEQLNDILTDRFKKQRNKAKNLALDQTRKLYNKVNASRMKTTGIKRFTWHHSGGSQRPREDHVKLNNTVHSFDDLPVINQKTGIRGLPGDEINCGCFMTPVVSFDDGSMQ